MRALFLALAVAGCATGNPRPPANTLHIYNDGTTPVRVEVMMRWVRVYSGASECLRIPNQPGLRAEIAEYVGGRDYALTPYFDGNRSWSVHITPSLLRFDVLSLEPAEPCA